MRISVIGGQEAGAGAARSPDQSMKSSLARQVS